MKGVQYMQNRTCSNCAFLTGYWWGKRVCKIPKTAGDIIIFEPEKQSCPVHTNKEEYYLRMEHCNYK